MTEENNSPDVIRESIQSNTNENILRDTNLKDIEKILEKEEKDVKEVKKVNSIGTVFSIGNSVIGSSLLTLPYDVYKTGIVPSVIKKQHILNS